MTSEPWWLQRHEVDVSPDAAWVGRCSAWLQRPAGDLGPAAWLVLLQPEHLDADFRLPEGTLQVAAVLEWQAPATDEPFEVVIEPVWASPRRESTEVAIDVRARRGGDDLARCRGIYRVPGDLDPFGEPVELHRPAEPTTEPRRLRLTLDEAQVEAFASVSNTHDRLHEDPGYAHQQGFPGVVVQGLLVAATVMHHTGTGASGTARFWFRRPVAAGTLLRLETAEGEAGTTRCWVRKATEEIVAVAEVEAPPAS